MKLTQLFYFKLIASYPVLDYLYSSKTTYTRRDLSSQTYNYEDYVDSKYEPVKVLDHSKAGNVHEIEMKFERRIDRLELISNTKNYTFIPANLMKSTGKAYHQAKEAMEKARTHNGMEKIINKIYVKEFTEEFKEIDEAEANSKPLTPNPNNRHL